MNEALISFISTGLGAFVGSSIVGFRLWRAIRALESTSCDSARLVLMLNERIHTLDVRLHNLERLT